MICASLGTCRWNVQSFTCTTDRKYESMTTKVTYNKMWANQGYVKSSFAYKDGNWALAKQIVAECQKRNDLTGQPTEDGPLDGGHWAPTWEVVADFGVGTANVTAQVRPVCPLLCCC